MSNVLLLEAIGYLDDDLLERSEKKQQTPKRTWVGWVALAACMCFVLVGAWGLLNPVKSNDSADQAVEFESDSRPTLDMEEPGDSSQFFQNVTDDAIINNLAVHFVQMKSLSPENFSSATAIRDRKQLEEYLNGKNDSLSSSEWNKVFHKYDEKFFGKKQLIILRLEGNSSSVSHELWDITEEQNEWKICIQRVYPKQLTKDLVYWCALIEVDAGTICQNDQITIEYLDISDDN